MPRFLNYKIHDFPSSSLHLLFVCMHVCVHVCMQVCACVYVSMPITWGDYNTETENKGIINCSYWENLWIFYEETGWGLGQELISENLDR